MPIQDYKIAVPPCSRHILRSTSPMQNSLLKNGVGQNASGIAILVYTVSVHQLIPRLKPDRKEETQFRVPGPKAVSFSFYEVTLFKRIHFQRYPYTNVLVSLFPRFALLLLLPTFFLFCISNIQGRPATLIPRNRGCDHAIYSVIRFIATLYEE